MAPTLPKEFNIEAAHGPYVTYVTSGPLPTSGPFGPVLNLTEPTAPTYGKYGPGHTARTLTNLRYGPYVLRGRWPLPALRGQHMLRMHLGPFVKEFS